MFATKTTLAFKSDTPSVTSEKDADLNAITNTSSHLGYLVFPPEGQFSSYDRYLERKEKVRTLKEERKAREAEDKRKVVEDAESQWSVRQEKELEARMERLKLEEEEARKGEESWVRSGGVLRDKDGKRDWERTRKVKAELELRDKEEALVKRWEDYEERWKDLLSYRGPKPGEDESELTFVEIPWPILPTTPFGTWQQQPKIQISMTKAKPKEVESKPNVNLFSITPSSVEGFLLADLTVRNRGVTRRERIRASLLRWHPDKLTLIRRRVVEEDKESVEQGIKIVFGVLSSLNNAESLEKSVRM